MYRRYLPPMHQSSLWNCQGIERENVCPLSRFVVSRSRKKRQRMSWNLLVYVELKREDDGDDNENNNNSNGISVDNGIPFASLAQTIWQSIISRSLRTNMQYIYASFSLVPQALRSLELWYRKPIGFTSSRALFSPSADRRRASGKESRRLAWKWQKTANCAYIQLDWIKGGRGARRKDSSQREIGERELLLLLLLLALMLVKGRM